MQPFVGQVIAVGFNFAPVDWALCNGQLLSGWPDCWGYQAAGKSIRCRACKRARVGDARASASVDSSSLS